MQRSEAILVLHDGDPVGTAIVRKLRASGTEVRELPTSAADDATVPAALGSRAIVGVGDSLVAAPSVFSAASMPGVRSLVFVIRGSPDLTALRKRGFPYVVLRRAPLMEELLDALAPALGNGKLTHAGEDPTLATVALEDLAECAIQAIDDEGACGRIIDVVSPVRIPLSELATRCGSAVGKAVKFRKVPRWALAPMRVLGFVTFSLPSHMTFAADPVSDLSLLTRSWRTVEQVATAWERERSEKSHAVGMQ